MLQSTSQHRYPVAALIRNNSAASFNDDCNDDLLIPSWANVISIDYVCCNYVSFSLPTIVELLCHDYEDRVVTLISPFAYA